jgi:hypothetical protein
MPGIAGDFLKALGPVIAPSREDRHVVVGKLDLDPVAIELDLVDPARTVRYTLGGCGKGRLHKAGQGGFDPWFRRLFTLDRHTHTRVGEPDLSMPGTVWFQ